jgi:hypothetical protein
VPDAKNVIGVREYTAHYSYNMRISIGDESYRIRQFGYIIDLFNVLNIYSKSSIFFEGMNALPAQNDLLQEIMPIILTRGIL